MEKPDTDTPQPNSETQVSSPPVETEASPRPRKRSWLLVSALGVVGLLLIAGLSAVGGYLSGISLRRSAESTQIAQIAQEQYQLALEDMGQSQFSRARQRLEYVIQIAPEYPGAVDKLSEVLLALNTTATPTTEPTPTLSPTPDLRGVEELFNQGQQFILNSDWSSAIDVLLTLRKADPSYRVVEVDGMLFLALRNRGRQKITSADLEGGIYDLTLANRFGPLDVEAQGLLNGSKLYITGASFWEIDWEQVVNYFSQVAPQYPSLMDGSGMTATERLRVALFEYGNWLVNQGKWCKAVEQYQLSLSIGYDASVEQAGLAAAEACARGSQPDATQPNP